MKKRDRIIQQINTGQLDPKVFYEYYEENGGNLPFPIFLKMFALFSAGANILDLHRKMCIDYKINFLFDKNNEFVKAI